MKALVCVSGRGWQGVVRGAARYLPSGGTEAALLHVVDERAARGGYDLALRGLLGRSRRPAREPGPEAASREAGEALLREARRLLASLRPDLKLSTAIRNGPPNQELVGAALELMADIVLIGRGEPSHRDEGRTATVSGGVTGWRHGPRGEANGFVLEDGTEVRFPPHRADDVRAIAREGALLEVEGEWRGPERRHLHAQRLTDADSGARVELAPEQPRGGPGKRPLGRAARYVVDHARCDVVVVLISPEPGGPRP